MLRVSRIGAQLYAAEHQAGGLLVFRRCPLEASAAACNAARITLAYRRRLAEHLPVSRPPRPPAARSAAAPMRS